MLGLFKGKNKGNLLHSPCNGKVVPITEVPDSTFADKILGDGFAVIPSEGKVYAPADGEVSMVFDTLHAVTMTSTQGTEILIHIGLDTLCNLRSTLRYLHNDHSCTWIPCRILVLSRCDGLILLCFSSGSS